MYPWFESPKEDLRNIETLLARPIHGKGKPFEIQLKGEAELEENRMILLTKP